MTKLCFSNPVIRDGTSQQQRLVKALLPDFVSIDERDFTSLKQFVREFAEEIRFIFPDGSDADWVRFFDRKAREDQTTDPDYALFQAFLELFKIAQDDLNTLTKRHLDFYYEDVLRLRGKSPVPDKAFITFEPGKHIEEVGTKIAKGTRLKAGKDNLGKNVFYTTTKEIVVNKGVVSEIKNLFRDPQTADLFKSPVANSGDGLGGDFENDAMSWPPFGSKVTGEEAKIGFAVASPILRMAEGTRIVKLCMQLTNLSADQKATLSALTTAQWNEAIKVFFSGEEAWLSPSMEKDALVTNDLLNMPEFRGIAAQKALDFINAAQKWEDIAGVEPAEGPVFDSRLSGYGDQRKDYDIGKTVAEQILIDRAKLPQQKFTSLEQLRREVYGIGVDKINDLLYSFCDSAFHHTSFDPTSSTLCIIRSLGRDQEAVVGYVEEALIDPFKTSWPVMKIVLQNVIANAAGTGPQSVYPDLLGINIGSATMEVEVQGVRNLIVQNDQTVMDPAKTMLPFGIIPGKKSNFYIGSQEVFQKSLNRLDIHLKWHGLPDESFDSLYENYLITDANGVLVPVPGLEERGNDSFKADIELLQGKSWQPKWPKQNLFTFDVDEPVDETRDFSLSIDEGEFLRNPYLPEIDTFDNSVQQGFARLSLSGTDFGHSDFQFVFTKQVLLDPNNLPNAKIPKEPYTPQLKEVSLNYNSSVSFNLVSKPQREIEQFFHLSPFGASKKDPGPSITLLPQYINEGECYIGIDELHPPQNITLLVQLLEGSEDPNVPREEPVWSYLSRSGWIPFETPDILSDSTNGLLTSGIVELAVPKTASDKEFLFTHDLHWIRVSVPSGTGAIPQFVSIIAQAVTVEFEDNGNDPLYLDQALPKETIKKLEFSNSDIKKLKQPFASFGGKIREENTPFYRRISERLRHKQRAVAIWDYERLVLHEFPFLYKVKCLNHTKYSTEDGKFSDLAPGHVTIIAVSDVQNLNGVNPFQPQTSLNKLELIREFLLQYNSPAVTLHVRNPKYETVRVECDVLFRPNFDVGLYTRELEDAIKAFLSPWAYSDGVEIVFGGRIHKSTIIDFIDELPYVDFVTCLKLYQNKNPEDPESVAVLVDEAVASTSASILCSHGSIDNYQDHKIGEAKQECGNCEDNQVDPPPVKLSADSCAQEAIEPVDEDDPYEYSQPNMDLCPEPEEIDDCDAEEPGPGTVVTCVLKDTDQNDYFDQINSKFVPKLLDITYLLPQSDYRTVNVEVTEVIDNRTIRVAGLHQAFTRMEAAGRVIENPHVYHIKNEVFEGDTTRLNITNRDHQITVGDRINLFRHPANSIQELYLPQVTQQMVDDEARLRFQVVTGVGNNLQLRRADFEGLDRLQLLNDPNTNSTNISLSVGSSLKTYAVEVEATAFETLSGYSDFGWKVLNENINYFQECLENEETDNWDNRYEE